MKTSFAAVLFAASLAALPNTDFSGIWEFSPAKSKNVGMMTQMKSTATIQQTPGELEVKSVSVFNGDESKLDNRFDLTGKASENETPMGAKEQTITRWEGQKLVTVWTGHGSVAGTTTTRTETRYLSSDDRTMTVESSHRNGPPMVMVYERK